MTLRVEDAAKSNSPQEQRGGIERLQSTVDPPLFAKLSM
jgi:hypothetical protein